VLRILGSLFYFGAWTGAAITFLMWLHRSYRNLPALGATELRFSPGWAVGWWFVPFANFVQPVRVVTEVWQASQAAHGQNTRAGRRAIGTPLPMWLWWGLWVGSIVLLLALGATNLELLAEYATAFGAAALAIKLIRAITRFQVETQRLSPAVVSAIPQVGRRRLLGLPAAVVIVLISASILGFGGLIYSSLLFSGPGDKNCVGQANVLQPSHLPDGTLVFSGTNGPHGQTSPFTATFQMLSRWQIAWDSELGELHIDLYSASIKHPDHSWWNPFHDNEAGHLEQVYSSTEVTPQTGSIDESRSGKFCLTISSGFHYDPNVDVSKLTAQWTVRVTQQ
jgi:hypothetical protein